MACIIGPQVLQAQGMKVPYRDLPRSLVPTPEQLLEKLSGLQGVNLPKSATQKLMDLGEKMLSGMDDQQKEYLRGLAEEVQRGKNPPLPPELRELAKKLQRSMLPEDAGINLKDILRELPDDPKQPLSNSSQRNSAANQDSRMKSNPKSSPQPRTQPTVPPIFDTAPVFDEGDAEQIVNRLEETISQLPEDEVFKPESDWFQSSPDEEIETSAGNAESVGNRFDRMIMEAVQNQMSDAGESSSPLADSVGDLFGGLVDHVHGRLNERDWGPESRRRQETGMGATASSPRSWLSQGGLSSSWDAVSNAGSGKIFVWLGWLLFVIAFLALAVWWIGRTVTLQKLRERVSPLSFGRKSKIQNSPDFVRAVDRFLLQRYGKPSSWWHAGRAEVALNAESPNMQSSIHHLVQCYEYARYSEVGQTLSVQDISKCRETLNQLATRPRPEISSQENDVSN